MSNDDKKAAILIMKAAADVRQAAVADKKRAAELLGVADYLESIVYESELGYGEPLFPESTSGKEKVGDEIKQMIKPFRIRLSR
tara:strand:- start:129 stop:380 length:252 start_codon:yes stop_codon:yes gene_type:complete